MTIIRTINRRWQRIRRWQKISAVLFGLVAIAALGIYLWIFSGLPPIDRLQAGMALPSTRILDRHGRLLYEIIPPKGGRNTSVPLSQIPQPLVQATIATEDRNFYATQGVDLEGVVRALWINLEGGEIKAGGSTITQQVARNLLLDPQERAARTLQRKLKEMVLAVRLAQSYSHADILALYLNQSYYGNMAYGVQAAAQVYFRKDVQALDLAECAMLAGLTQSPATYDPLTNPSTAKDRQKVVLGLMVEAGDITQAQADEAAAEPLQYGSASFHIEAPHFVLQVWNQVAHDYPDALYRGGLEVTTTLDLDWQHAAQEVARRHIDELNHPPAGQQPHNATDAALVAMDPLNGQVLAMLGSVDYFDEEINGAVNMAVSPRQPGSALKPFTYSLSFDPNQSNPWTPATMLLDVSTPFITQRLQSYTPSNFGLVEHGPVLIREALASSYNIPAVVALDHVGLSSLLNLLHRLGITTLQDQTRLDLSVTLGGGEVRLLELTAAYAAFDNGGSPIKPSMILNVQDSSGATLYQWQPPKAAPAVIDPRVAYLITDILSDNNARLPEFGDHSALLIGRPAAVKTGTTTDFRDNWTVGYSSNLVVGVWVGNANNTPMINVSGVSGAGPIWNEFMRAVLNGQPELTFQRPPGLVQAQVCAVSGLLPTPLCPATRLDWFIDGTVPTQPDNLFHKFTIDRDSGALADDVTPPDRRQDKVFEVLPQEARDWGLRHGIEPPPVAAHAVAPTSADSSQGLHLLMPDPYTVYQLTPVVPFDSQQIRFSAAVPPGTVQVTYYLDGQAVSSAGGEPWWVWWNLIPGQHTLKAVATLDSGQTQTSDPVPFTVQSYVPPEEQPASGEVK
ncbi:MAG TPA: penicillin-binding protein 1C [Aggregatilineales bacterium]|nr:penicillin-binding protein 1C [Aggregatilineales bacterium]